MPTTIAFNVEKSSDNCLKGVDKTAHSSFNVRPIKTADPSKNSVASKATGTSSRFNKPSAISLSGEIISSIGR